MQALNRLGPSARRCAAAALVLAAVACGGRSGPIPSGAVGSVLQVTVPGGVTADMIDGVRALQGVSWTDTQTRNMLLVGLDVDADAAAVARLLAQHLRVNLSVPAPRAFLAGRAASRLFGSFSYIVHPDGTIAADPRWVRGSIVGRKVPILGWVRCHRLMVPQLFGALREIQRTGLAGLIDAPDYRASGGCYVSRTIMWDPHNPPSMHAWGLAIDMNVARNPYGRTPTQDPRVVGIFKRWGFAWGGDWQIPDGMHFELAALLRR